MNMNAEEIVTWIRGLAAERDQLQFTKDAIQRDSNVELEKRREAEKEVEKLEKILADVANWDSNGLCWCPTPREKGEHQPYCTAAREALGVK